MPTYLQLQIDEKNRKNELYNQYSKLVVDLKKKILKILGSTPNLEFTLPEDTRRYNLYQGKSTVILQLHNTREDRFYDILDVGEERRICLALLQEIEEKANET